MQRQINMITETITVRDEISSQYFEVNNIEHQHMQQSTQLLLDYIQHTQKEIYRIWKMYNNMLRLIL